MKHISITTLEAPELDIYARLSRLFPDDLRHAWAGKLQVIDGWYLFLPHLIDQVGDRLGTRLRIRTAS